MKIINQLMNRSRRLNLWGFSLFLSFFGLSSTICFGQEQDLPHNSPSTGADGALFFSDVPFGRHGHTMAYDPTRNVIVLFGGRSNSGSLSDTWEYDGNTWTQSAPILSPPARSAHTMAYDPTRNVIVLFGGLDSSVRVNDTWEYDGNTWTQSAPALSPPIRSDHTMVYDPTRNVIVLFGGFGSSNTSLNDTWEYDGANWTQVESVASTRTINMADKPDGIWNYTSIYVGKNVTVIFDLNGAENTPPVQWLATDNVTIEGTLNLNGRNGLSVNSTNAAIPGPGGYAGGLGGARFDVSGSYAGTPGLGPGGGAPGVSVGARGQSGVYSGNAFLQPLLGGSGGGGQGSSDTSDGAGGGAGGGAILIDSSRDIMINGTITATGGIRGNSNAGFGSGGAIRLVADRIAGTGVLRADTSVVSGGASDGRIRLEAYYRSFLDGNVESSNPIANASAPVENSVPVGSEPQLVITSVDGVSVLNPPTGSRSNADVIFSDTGPVDIVVNATNVPDGSTVDLNVFTSGEIIAADPQILAGGTVTFTVTVPAGVGHLQASSSFLPTP